MIFFYLHTLKKEVVHKGYHRINLWSIGNRPTKRPSNKDTYKCKQRQGHGYPSFLQKICTKKFELPNLCNIFIFQKSQITPFFLKPKYQIPSSNNPIQN